MENVKALVSDKFMPEFKRWMLWLQNLGYNNFTQVMNAKDYGVPQNRERVFMVSILDESVFYFPKPYTLDRRLKDVLESNVDESYYLSDEKIQSIIEHCERKQAEGCGFKTNFQTPDGISGTIKTREGQREYDTYIQEDSLFDDDFFESEEWKKTGEDRVPDSFYKHFGNRLGKLIRDGKIDPSKLQYVDCYNQATRDDVTSTITARVDDGNHLISEQTTDDE